MGMTANTEYPLYLMQFAAVHRLKHTVNLVMIHRKKDEVDDLQKQCPLALYQLHGNVDIPTFPPFDIRVITNNAKGAKFDL